MAPFVIDGSKPNALANIVLCVVKTGSSNSTGRNPAWACLATKTKRTAQIYERDPTCREHP